MTNLSTKIVTAISILSIIAIGTTAASSPVQGQLSVEPQPENMSNSATNMTRLNITATGANTTTIAVTNASAANVTVGNATITNATAGYFCYNCANATAANATSTNATTSQ